MRIFDGTQCRDMTPEEISAMEAQARLAEIQERTRPMSADEVVSMLITQQINSLFVDDATAFRMKAFYPEWHQGTVYDIGFKVRRNDKLWRVRQAHTAQVGWEPENAASLWEEINETHDGTIDDPIPYDGNMALEQGKYYCQDNAIYLCVRDTVNPEHHPLSQLIEIYVEEV